MVSGKVPGVKPYKGVNRMDNLKNQVSEVPIARITEDEERQIQDLEQKFGDRYYLVAFEKS